MLKKLFGVKRGLKILGDNNQVEILQGSEDPTTSPGVSAPEGSQYLRYNGATYKKTGPNDTDWVKANTTTTSAGAGFIYITDITPQSSSDNVGEKQYVDGTVPPDTVLKECTADTTDVTVHFLAEGGPKYSPTVTLNGNTCKNLSQYGDDRRLFYGSIDVTLSVSDGESETLIVESSTEQTDSAIVNLSIGGPEITDISFGNYPGDQTALKENDTIDVTATVENSATNCWIENDKASKYYESLTLDADDSAGTGYKYATGTVTISSVTSDSPVDAQAENSLGTKGSVYTSSNLTIDQTYPSITFNSITYPTGQQALKNSETAEVDVSASDFDTISYSSPNSQLDIPSTSTYEQIKTVTRVGGDYNISNTNYRITATRTNNGASTTGNFVVNIANVAASLSINLPASRLRTGSTGYSDVGLTTASDVAEHTINIQSDQKLLSVPTLADPDSDKGVWKNSSFSDTGNMTSFTNVLQVDDASTRGTHNWGSISGTNLAGIETTTISSGNQYTIGGFIPRYYRLILGNNEVEANVEVSTYTKTTLEWKYLDGSGTVKELNRNSTINASPPVTKSWTIDAEDINPTTFIILDTAATEAQTKDTAILVEEEV